MTAHVVYVLVHEHSCNDLNRVQAYGHLIFILPLSPNGCCCVSKITLRVVLSLDCHIFYALGFPIWVCWRGRNAVEKKTTIFSSFSIHCGIFYELYVLFILGYFLLLCQPSFNAQKKHFRVDGNGNLNPSSIHSDRTAQDERHIRLYITICLSHVLIDVIWRKRLCCHRPHHRIWGLQLQAIQLWASTLCFDYLSISVEELSSPLFNRTQYSLSLSEFFMTLNRSHSYQIT